MVSFLNILLFFCPIVFYTVLYTTLCPARDQAGFVHVE